MPAVQSVKDRVGFWDAYPPPKHIPKMKGHVMWADDGIVIRDQAFSHLFDRHEWPIAELDDIRVSIVLVSGKPDLAHSVTLNMMHAELNQYPICLQSLLYAYTIAAATL